MVVPALTRDEKIDILLADDRAILVQEGASSVDMTMAIERILYGTKTIAWLDNEYMRHILDLVVLLE